MRNTTILSAILGIVFCYGSAIAQRNYTVNFNSANAISLDGEVADGEWAAAAGGGGEWELLRTDPPDADANGSQFRALWDEEALYLLYQSNDTAHPGSNGVQAQDVGDFQQNNGIDFNADNLNIYIDSNSDGESGEPQDEDGAAATDGYQIAFNIREGFSGLIGQGDNQQLFNTGTFLEAHVNTPFGNNGAWDQGVAEGYRQWEFVSTADDEGQTVEIRLPWETFDAPGIEDVDTSVFHPFAPDAGDEWIFNMSKINDDQSNFLPIWNWKTGNSFAPWPHGRLTFAEAPVDGIACDFDGNDICDSVDIDALMVDAVDGSNTATFDLTGDGNVDVADRDAWLAAAGTANGLSGPILLGDSNVDGRVDAEDLNAVGVNWISEAKEWSKGNFELDGATGVNSVDLNAVGINWLQSVPAAASAVPEPSSSGLIAIAGLFLLGLRRRRK